MSSDNQGTHMEDKQKVQEFPTWKAVRRKISANDVFFGAGNVARELLAKQFSLDISEEEKMIIGCVEDEHNFVLHCPIVGCGARLKGLADFENHHAARHTATCSVCSHVFPTSRLLNLHIAETHDSFFQAKVSHGYPMFECLVEGCSGRFQSNSSRLRHLVDKHQFPKGFRFHTKKHLSQHQRQRQKQFAYKQPQKPESHSKRISISKKHGVKEAAAQQDSNVEHNADEVYDQDTQIVFDEHTNTCKTEGTLAMDVDGLTVAISRLSTASQGTDNMPNVVSFGRRRSRGANLRPARGR